VAAQWRRPSGRQRIGTAPDSRLRREEVAQLSGVSVTWYTWLEQGRDISASAQVTDALARVLLLSGDQPRLTMVIQVPAGETSLDRVRSLLRDTGQQQPDLAGTEIGIGQVAPG
jgi:transcriptional regulator with XRE-family HTH domain